MDLFASNDFFQYAFFFSFWFSFLGLDDPLHGFPACSFKKGAGFDVKSPRENPIIRSTVNTLKNRSLFKLYLRSVSLRACQGRLLFPNAVLASLQMEI